MRGEVWNGKFEVVSVDLVHDVWNTLLTQQIMSRETIDSNLAASSLAWNLAAAADNSATSIADLVFDTDVKLSLLEDEARRRWVAKYIMNDPDCIK